MRETSNGDKEVVVLSIDLELLPKEFDQENVTMQLDFLGLSFSSVEEEVVETLGLPTRELSTPTREVDGSSYFFIYEHSECERLLIKFISGAITHIDFRNYGGN
jgi:hypothetical protein